jgi:hypothetical protein
VHASGARAASAKDGFVGFSCDRITTGAKGARRRIAAETAAQLRRLDRRN